LSGLNSLPPEWDRAPTDSFLQRLGRTVRRLRCRADWQALLGPGWPERIMDLPVREHLHTKQGRSVARLQLSANGSELTVFLKRHHRISWWRGLLAALLPGSGWSPGFQEWDHLEWARQQGVPVPRVVAAGEFVGPGCRLQSFLAVEELAGMIALPEAIPLAQRSLAPEAFRRWKRTLVTELARVTHLLHDRRTFHKDLYLCHFYVTRADTQRLPAWRDRVRVIDLHRLTHHAWTWGWWRIKDLAQLLYSSELAGIDDRDRLAFWRDYRGPGPTRSPQRWLRNAVLFKVFCYHRHNARTAGRRLVLTSEQG
jgi:heptose I phosphotransferase